MFRSVASTTPVEQISPAIPTSFSLEQNYPNPFYPSTTIQFALMKAVTVHLKVFDVSGRTVATLVHGALGPGTYKVIFEANGLPNGVYFYRMEGGELVQTMKLTLLR